ncbi:hypothetical protein Acr_06g0013200 [Actinidia rufa]|uniref:Uncharacterized protein n=1 Tax=Actinidia rufa TaxID=165716 RepID=A0A7J0ESS3_9ERIC|nr:hypothetical protein Acr_06g0013200 [Actinidia rufa]
MAIEAFFLCLQLSLLHFVSSEVSFTYNGFIQANLSLDGAAYVSSDGILVMANDTAKHLGHALHPSPQRFKESKLNNDNNKSFVVTFSTNFIFTIKPKYPDLGGHGLAFVLFSAKQPIATKPTTPLSSRVETPFRHGFEYNSQENLMSVTISPLGIPRPSRPLLSFPIDLSSVLNEYMIGGRATDLDLSLLSSTLPKYGKVVHSKGFAAGIALASVTLVLLVTYGAVLVRNRLRNGDEILEDWEVEYGARRSNIPSSLQPRGGWKEKPYWFLRIWESLQRNLNARIRDFGLARTCDHGIIPKTTHIVGTLGYLAPELTKAGKATTRTDVYGYCALMLESMGEITRAIDPTLEEYNPNEAKLVLGLGLLCSHPNLDFRPSMRRVVQFLLGDASLPQLPRDLHLKASGIITDYSDI